MLHNFENSFQALAAPSEDCRKDPVEAKNSFTVNPSPCLQGHCNPKSEFVNPRICMSFFGSPFVDLRRSRPYHKGWLYSKGIGNVKCVHHAPFRVSVVWSILPCQFALVFASSAANRWSSCRRNLLGCCVNSLSSKSRNHHMLSLPQLLNNAT